MPGAAWTKVRMLWTSRPSASSAWRYTARPAGHFEVGRAVLVDRHDAQVVLHAEGQRGADQERLVVGAAAHRRGADARGLLEHAQPLHLAPLHAGQALVDVLHEEPAGRRRRSIVSAIDRRHRPRLDEHRRVQADVRVGQQRRRGGRRGRSSRARCACVPGRPAAEQEHVLRTPATARRSRPGRRWVRPDAPG